MTTPAGVLCDRETSYTLRSYHQVRRNTNNMDPLIWTSPNMELELDDVYSTTGIDLRIKLWRGGSQASTQNKQQICRQEKRTPFAL